MISRPRTPGDLDRLLRISRNEKVVDRPHDIPDSESESDSGGCVGTNIFHHDSEVDPLILSHVHRKIDGGDGEIIDHGNLDPLGQFDLIETIRNPNDYAVGIRGKSTSGAEMIEHSGCTFCEFQRGPFAIIDPDRDVIDLIIISGGTFDREPPLREDI
jgi:hypothetical protein